MSAINESENRIGVVGIILESPDENVAKINDILHDFAGIIVGRMGIPYRQRGIAVIALTVDGTTDEIGAMTGRIGQFKNVNVKTALAPKK